MLRRFVEERAAASHAFARLGSPSPLSPYAAPIETHAVAEAEAEDMAGPGGEFSEGRGEGHGEGSGVDVGVGDGFLGGSYELYTDCSIDAEPPYLAMWRAKQRELAAAGDKMMEQRAAELRADMDHGWPAMDHKWAEQKGVWPLYEPRRKKDPARMGWGEWLRSLVAGAGDGPERKGLPALSSTDESQGEGASKAPEPTA